MNIMRWVLLSVLACVLGACASVVSVKKIDVKKDGESYQVLGEAPGEGVYYTLPRTVVKISMPMSFVSPKRITAQNDASDANGFISDKDCSGLKDKASNQDKVPQKNVGPVQGGKDSGREKLVLKPNFSDVSITTTSIPDPSQIFYVKIDKDRFADMSFMVKRSVYGQLQTIGASSVNRASDIVSEFSRYGASLGAGWLSGGFSATLPSVGGSSFDTKVYSTTSGDFSVDQLYLGKHFDSIITNDSEEDCSKHTLACLKLDFLKARKDILFGLVAPDASAEALQVRLNGMAELEKKLVDGCGNKTTSITLAYNIMPEDIHEELTDAYFVEGRGLYVAPLMEINEITGKVAYIRNPERIIDSYIPDRSCLGGHPGEKMSKRDKYACWKTKFYENDANDPNYVFLEVSPAASLGMAFKDTKINGLEGEHGFFYREPGMAKVELKYKKSTLASALVPIAQYGTVFAMPKTLYGKQMQHDVIFYYDTGAISSYAVNSASHRAEDLKPYYESMAEILNANLKLQQQQKAADAAAAKPAAAPATTTAAP